MLYYGRTPTHYVCTLLPRQPLIIRKSMLVFLSQFAFSLWLVFFYSFRMFVLVFLLPDAVMLVCFCWFGWLWHYLCFSLSFFRIKFFCPTKKNHTKKHAMIIHIMISRIVKTKFDDVELGNLILSKLPTIHIPKVTRKHEFIVISDNDIILKHKSSKLRGSISENFM